MTNLLAQNLKKHINLTDEEFSLFYSCMIPKTYNKKAFLFQSGEVARNTYFVHKGLLRLYQVSANGTEKTAVFATEGWWISDLYSFITQKPATKYLQAIEDVEVLALSKHNLEAMFVQIPKLERFFRIIQQNSFASQNERIMDMLSVPAADRYLKFIDKYPQAEQRISQKYIASYLGVTPEFLSGMKSKLNS